MLRKKRIMVTLLSILGILCLGYYIFLQIMHVDFAIVWLLAGIFFGGWGTYLWYLSSHDASMSIFLKGLLIVVIGIGLLIFLVTEGLIISKMNSVGAKDLDYVVVLGAQVKGDHPSRALRKRIEKAAEYLDENPMTVAILSGGQGPGEDLSEAQCMYDELVKLGIDSKRFIMEDKSTTTRENLIFSARLAPVKEKHIGLISQNFHMYRSLQLAKKQGYRYVEGIAAPSEWIYQPHFMVREAFALVKEKLSGNI